MEKGGIVASVYLYVRRGTFKCFFFVDLVQYLNLSSKNFIPKEGWHSRAISKWSL